MSRINLTEISYNGDRSKGFLSGLYLGLTLLLLMSYLDSEHNSLLDKATNIYGVQALAGAILGFWRIWAVADNPRKTPALASVWICFGLTGWVIGQGVWVLGSFTFEGENEPYPWWSDIAYITSVVCWLIALFTVFKSLQRRVLATISPFLAILTTAMGLLVGFFIWLEKKLLDAQMSSDVLTVLSCDLVYIILTFLSMILAVGLAVGNNAEIPFPVHRFIHYLVAATTIDAAATLAFTVTTKLPKGDPLKYFNGNWVDWLLLTAMYFWGMSALKCPVAQKQLRYTFGTARKNEVRIEDIYRAGEIAESFAQAAHKTEQLIIDSDSTKWILDAIPECWNVVKLGDLVVGSTFVFPVPRPLVQSFARNEKTERQMFEEVRRNALRWDCLYIADASILPNHRRRGLAFKCLIKTIEKVAKEHQNPGLEVYCWSITIEGEGLAEKLQAYFENRGIRVIEVERPSKGRSNRS